MNTQQTLPETGKSWIKQHPILSVIGVIFVIGLIGSIVDPSEKQSAPEINNQVVQQTIFDIPSLIGKNIDEVEMILGKSKSLEPTQEQVTLISEWEKEFTKDNFTLLVTYDHKTRVIKDFFVSATDEIYESRDKDKMMSVTNTKNSDSKYSVEFVKALKDSTRFTGILVTAK